MAGQPMSLWRIILRSYPCETCGAGPGEPCLTSGGRQAGMEHAAREMATARCPRCATWLDADWPQGSLCPRCQLLHDLNTERATTHRRTT